MCNIFLQVEMKKTKENEFSFLTITRKLIHDVIGLCLEFFDEFFF